MAVSDRVKSGPEKAPHRSLWKALGLTDADLPTDVEGLYDLLVRFRDEDPNGNGEADEIAWGLTDGFDHLKGSIIGAFGLPSNEVYADDDGKMQYGMMQEEQMVNFLTYVKKLNNPNPAVRRVRLKGLEANAQYVCEQTRLEVSGDTLMNAGVNLPDTRQDFDSVRWVFTRI